MRRKNKSKKVRFRLFFAVLKLQIVLLVLIAAGLGYYYFSGYAAMMSEMHMAATELVQESTSNTFRSSETSIVYDSKSKEIQKLRGEKDVYYINYDKIPVYVTQALISIEDKRFYRHNGIDIKGVARAAIALYENKGLKTQGGSTITQQLSRTIFLSTEKTWKRKIQEMYIAVELEKKYSKEQILEFYLNNVYFGNGYYGIKAAANGYFNREVDELNLSEICFLIAIPNNPAKYDPVANIQNTIRRRDLILDSMEKDRMITEVTANKAKKAKIKLERVESQKYDYISTYADYCATKVLMELDGFEFQNEFASKDEQEIYDQLYNEVYSRCNHSLFTGGYRIYTSIDTETQALLQSAVDDCLSEFTDCTEEGVYELQSAAVCIDNYTGQVKAIIGGRSQDYVGYSLNRGFQSYRQPGSAIKPLVVYTPALEAGYTPDTIVVDEPMEDGPQNSSRNYSGQITIRQAVMYSKNTIAWKLFQELTPEVALKYLLNMGFSKIVENDYYPATALGGMTYGVSPLEMAKAYATLENDGYARDPGCIVKITDSQGNIIYENSREEKAIYKENAARNMTNMLQSVVTDGTAKGISLGDMPCAGKTGTTDNNRDGWFVGYTPYYTTSVWVGYDLPKKLPGLQGSSYPAIIWQTFMKDMHANLTPADFLLPVKYIGNEEELSDEEEVFDNFEDYEPEERTITQTFDGTEVPEGAIPEDAVDVTITTVTQEVEE